MIFSSPFQPKKLIACANQFIAVEINPNALERMDRGKLPKQIDNAMIKTIKKIVFIIYRPYNWRNSFVIVARNSGS